LREHFVKKKLLDKKYVRYYKDVHSVAKEIVHGKISRIKGKDLDEWFRITDDFLGEMARLVDLLIDENRSAEIK
jgi:hypothetical protein